MTFNPAPQRASQRHKGAATAHMLTTRAAENGQSADYIQQRHDELLGQFADESTLSAGEREWLAGYRDEARGTVALLRDVERASAEDRVTRQPELEAEAG
jgi:hypothetical protein